MIATSKKFNLEDQKIKEDILFDFKAYKEKISKRSTRVFQQKELIFEHINNSFLNP